jgi:hypothetical protein
MQKVGGTVRVGALLFVATGLSTLCRGKFTDPPSIRQAQKCKKWVAPLGLVRPKLVHPYPEIRFLDRLAARAV